MKKTAVDWFQEQIIKIVCGTCELSEIEIFEQAKEMEKEQIINAWCNALDLKASKYAEQYYNETFKSE